MGRGVARVKRAGEDAGLSAGRRYENRGVDGRRRLVGNDWAEIKE